MKYADVKLETGQAKILYDDTKQTPEKLAAAVERPGVKASVVSVTTAPTSEAPPGDRRMAIQKRLDSPHLDRTL